MIREPQIDDLRMKILPPGGTQIIAILEHHKERITLTSLALENVPLLIIARHGMIARQLDSSGQKISQPDELCAALRNFFSTSDMLYVYVNLPALPIPSFVNELLTEVEQKAHAKYLLRQQIDAVLISGNRAEFQRLVKALQALD